MRSSPTTYFYKKNPKKRTHDQMDGSISYPLRRNTCIYNLKRAYLEDNFFNKIKQNKISIDLDLTKFSLSNEEINKIIGALKNNVNFLDVKIKIENEKINKLLKFYVERNQQLVIAARYLAQQISSIWCVYGLGRELEKCETYGDVYTIVRGVETYFLFAPVKRMLQTLDMLRNVCIIGDCFPIHVFAEKGSFRHILELIRRGASTEAKDLKGKTALFWASEDNYKNMVGDLEANPEVTTENGLTPFHAAISRGCMPILNKSSHKYNVDVLKKRRELYYVFGGEKMRKTKQDEPIDGGFFIEALQVIINKLKEFIQKAHIFTETEKVKLSRFIINLQQSEKNYHLDFAWNPDAFDFLCAFADVCEQRKKAILKNWRNAKLEDILILETGYVGHVVGAALEKDKNGCTILHVADRGDFSDYFPKRKNNKRCSIKSINIPNDLIDQVVGHLCQALSSDRNSAEKVIFGAIPELVGSAYTDHPFISQSLFKTGICFFANLKSLVLNAFVSMFAQERGYTLYKEFTLFLRNEIANEYKETRKYKDSYFFKAKEIVAGKRKKLTPIVTRSCHSASSHFPTARVR